MRGSVRIVGLKEPYLTYRTRRLLPGHEMEVPGAIATIFTRRGFAAVAERQSVNHTKPQTPMEGDDLSVLRALASSRGVDVDGRWGAKRLKNEIAKKR